MYIKREIEDVIERRSFKKKAIIIYGARQTGKTTLVKNLMKKYDDALYFNADFINDREIWKPKSVDYLKTIIQNHKLIVIDEAQNIVDIGLVLKTVVDNFPKTQIIATGSSSFDLSNKTGESMTGRKWTFVIHPFSYRELARSRGNYQVKNELDFFLTYGMYPEIYNEKQDAELLLTELINSYLLKDILMWANIKKSEKLIHLLQLLAFQIGQMVSYNELSKNLNIDFATVQKYINLLEKCFIIYKLPSFSKNMRNEIKKSRKIYFWDIGIRNAIIDDFTPFDIRRDKGQIWENFIITELIKNKLNQNKLKKFYFWRSKDKAEIDLLEIKNKNIKAFEIKLTKKNVRIPPSFKYYEPKSFSIIHKDNFEEYLL